MPSIRPLAESDLCRAARLLVDARLISSVKAALDEIQAYRSHDPGLLLGAYLDGHLVGVAIASFDGYRGMLRRVVIDADLRQQGLGSKLATALEERLVERGARLLRVHTKRDDDLAEAFWKRQGYRPIPLAYLGKSVNTSSSD
jgi:ribosomal protein S18 acetylase RimI-like enzyme